MDEEHKPVTIAEVIAGGQTITTHCLACGDRGELDPRVLPVVEGGSRFTRDRAWTSHGRRRPLPGGKRPSAHPTQRT